MPLDDTPSAFTDKSGDFIPLIGCWKFFLNIMNSLCGIHSLGIDIAVDFKDVIDLVNGETLSFKSDGIHPGITQRGPSGLDIGGERPC